MKNTTLNPTELKAARARRVFGAAGAAAALLSLAAAAYADAPVSMAPPIQGDGGYQSYSNDSSDANADSVFNWREVPQNQNVPIERAVFDQGGYQLYDTAGETIVVPFTDDNLYVMKFAVSDNGQMYFVNTGDCPILYVPVGGYLDNASVPGARWVPFTDDFQPADPVFLGCAPSWHAFIDMGWYSGMVCHGGYWCHTPDFAIGALLPTVGLYFQIGGDHIFGWGGYDQYCDFHRAPYSVTIVNRNIYRWGRPGYLPGRQFDGTGSWNGDHSRSFTNNSWDNRSQHFQGAQGFHAGGWSSPDRGDAARQYGGAGRVFRGADPQAQSFSGGPGQWNASGNPQDHNWAEHGFRSGDTQTFSERGGNGNASDFGNGGFRGGNGASFRGVQQPSASWSQHSVQPSNHGAVSASAPRQSSGWSEHSWRGSDAQQSGSHGGGQQNDRQSGGDAQQNNGRHS